MMDIASKQMNFFTRKLVDWHDTVNDRDLPWKNEKDPYKIWLSEIILQQTRAAQGAPYYLRFLQAYPTIVHMAAAADDEVFRIWQGLGYYNRCRNMLATARFIASELNGVFPRTYEGIIALKGIGPYTAAAIASFAYGLPHAVVDGNVYRVLARFFAISTPFDTTTGKKQFAELATSLLDPAASAAYNQAIMDLGATICLPRNAKCEDCPVRKNCLALAHNIINELPVRSKKVAVTTRYFHFLLLRWNDKIWIQRREQSDIWQGLHQPLLVEAETELPVRDFARTPVFKELGLQPKDIRMVCTASQRLTHRIVKSVFFEIDVAQPPKGLPENGRWLSPAMMGDVAFPKTILSFLNKNAYF